MTDAPPAAVPPAVRTLAAGWHRAECWLAMAAFTCVAALLMFDVLGREVFAPLLRALESFGDDTGLIFTGANADTGGTAINEAMMNFAASRDNACFHPSLGPAGYYSLVALADLVVGNSSSGLYEAPSLHTPTLDIGIRQQGRLRGASVHNVANDTGAIGAAIRAMLQTPPSMFDNPYGDGHAGERIANTLLALRDPRQLLHKHFVERRCD